MTVRMQSSLKILLYLALSLFRHSNDWERKSEISNFQTDSLQITKQTWGKSIIVVATLIQWRAHIFVDFITKETTEALTVRKTALRKTGEVMMLCSLWYRFCIISW